MKTRFLSTGLLIVMTTTATPHALPNEVIERARSLELDTPYVRPPGDPLAHHAAGYAKVMCSAVFISGCAPVTHQKQICFFCPRTLPRIRFKRLIEFLNLIWIQTERTRNGKEHDLPLV